MYFVPFFLFSSIALAAKTTHNGYTVTGGELPRLSKRTPTLEKPLTLPLRRLNGSPPSQKYLRALTTGISNRVNLQEVFWGSSYLAPMTLSNGQQFQMVLDTGSSDTWIIQDGFICADPYTIEVIPQSECGFGLTYDPSTFRQILDENFNTVYGDGEMLAGAVGYENVTLANTTVPNQIIASVNLAAYNGDNISSGLIGLAYPNLTQAYPGNDPWADDPGIENDIPYSPLFTTMWQTLGVPPLFSLALARGNDTSNGGVLSLGGLPQGLNYSSNFISTPIKLMQVEEGPDLSNASFTSAFFAFYAVDVDSISIPAPYSNPSYSNTSGHRDHRLGQIPHPRARKPTTSRNYFTKRDLNRNGRPQYDLMDRLFPRQAIAGPESSPKGGPEEGPGPGVGVEPSVGDPGVSPSSGPEAPPGGSVIPADGEGQSIVMIVDSGTTINYFPNNIAEAINSAFSPPAEFDPQTGEYYVDCDAVAPRIGITINGTEFFVNPHDMILHNIELGDDAPPDMETPCGSGAGSAGADGTYVLGDVFLKNVLAVFDVGAGEMRFTARENY